jgi:drug/metabolite transporter (DMT)-like permease
VSTSERMEEASVGSSLEHLIAGSQGVITKRLDLAVLEAEDLFSRGTERAALIGVAMILLAGACFAMTGTLASVVVPETSPQLRMALFGLLNAVAAIGAVQLARRRGRRIPPTAPRDETSNPGRDHSRAGEED